MYPGSEFRHGLCSTRREAASGSLDEERHDVGPDEKLCDTCRRQDETVGCLVTHGDGESTQDHVCPEDEGDVSLFTRVVTA